MPRLASLAMYAAPPPVAEASEALWIHLAGKLREAGLDAVPDAFCTQLPYRAAWTHADLLLAQTCGYPYISTLRGKVKLVATPVYDHPGCDGPDMVSFIIVRESAPISKPGALRGSVAALNAHDSNSGMNLFRAAIAPLADGGAFFGQVIETGSHQSSLEAIQSGKADVAAIDCITFGNFARYAPETVSGLRILARTPSGPGLPLITAAGTSDVELAILRNALFGLSLDPVASPILAALGLTGFSVLDDSDYDRLAALERDAIDLGYPAIN